ncbi:hypothetical protein LCGC14_2379210, partial [marine sediment metagenome]
PPSALRDALLDAKADVEHVSDGWRIFDAYADRYESVGDYIEPLAIEELVVDPVTGNSCRYDLIAHVNDDAKHLGIMPGTYVIEFKSAGRLDIGTTDGWHLDGEVIGQLMLWKKAKLRRKYGKLQGVIVDIVTKAKVPKFHREIVAPPNNQLNAQENDLVMWESLQQLFRATKRWPRSLQACYGKYGPCEYVEHCREHPR